jgi:hypothetical protein
MNATTQLILTYVILTLVTGYVIYKLRKILFPRKEESAGCGSDCGCDAVKLKKEILNSDKTHKSHP